MCVDDQKTGAEVAKFSNREDKQPRSPVRKWAKTVRSTFISDSDETKAAAAGKIPKKRKQSQTLKSRRGRHTVPKPFAGVEARATIKHMSRSMERTLADLAQKEEEERRAMNHKWSAKPIPRSTRERRYEALKNKAEALRIKNVDARRSRLQETVKPFRGMEERDRQLAMRRKRREEKRIAEKARTEEKQRREKQRQERAFRAAAAKSAAVAQDQTSLEVERRVRIQRRAAKLLQESKMPNRMAMWAKTQKYRKSESSNDLNASQIGQTKQKLNKISRMEANEIRDHFRRSHARFKRSLQQAKQSQAGSEPKPFSFMSTQRMEAERLRKEQTKARIERQKLRDQKVRKAKETRMKKLAKSMKAQKHPLPRQTEKSRTAQECIRRKIQEQHAQKRKLEAGELERQRKLAASSQKLGKELKQRIVCSHSMPRMLLSFSSHLPFMVLPHPSFRLPLLFCFQYRMNRIL